MFDQRKRHFKSRIKVLKKKIWDFEYLKYEMKSMREGFRMQYDRMREEMDACKRRLAGEKWSFYYIASGDEIGYREIPILPDDFENLPDEQKDTKDFRFYKKTKANPDKDVVKNLEVKIQQYSDDIAQITKQMEAVDGQIEGPKGYNEQLDGFKTAINLINEYLLTDN